MTRLQLSLGLIALGAVAAALMASDAVSRPLLFNSLVLAAGACAIAVPIGTALAMAISRTDLAGRRLAAACLGLLLVLPLLVQLSGWDALAGKLGWYSLETEALARPWLSGMRGAIWVHAMAAVPWVALIVSLGLLQVDPQLEEIALLNASPLEVLLCVSLVQAWPFLGAAAVWTAVSTTTEMTVTNIYLVNTYTEQLYNGFALNSDPLQVGWRLWPGIALLLVLGVAIVLVLARLAEAWAKASYRPALVFPLRGTRPVVTAMVWTVLVVLVSVPIVSLLAKAGYVTNRTPTGALTHGWSAGRVVQVLVQAATEFRWDFFWSLVTALLASAAAMGLAIVLTWHALRGGWRLVPLAGALMLGLAIPGPLIGISIIWLLNRESIPGFTWLYDRTVVPPGLGQMIRALPIAVLICWPGLASVPRATLEAAQLDGLTRWQQLWWIVIPQRRVALAAAWLIAAAVAFGDLSHSLLVIPPGMDTIQRRVFGLVHAGVQEQVAAACLLMVAGYIVCTAFAWRWLSRGPGVA